MKLSEKINIKKALIVFPIVVVMAGTTLIGAFSTGFVNDEASKAESESVVGENLEDVIDDERALKIIDIHENLTSYIDKEVTLEGFFIKFDKDSQVFGVEVPLSNHEITMTSLTYELDDPKALEKISDTDLVKATGVISSFEQIHEDEEQGDHNHTLPKFKIKTIEVVR